MSSIYISNICEKVKSYDWDQKPQSHQPKTFVTWFEKMFGSKYLMAFYVFTNRFLIDVVYSSKIGPMCPHLPQHKTKYESQSSG